MTPVQKFSSTTSRYRSLWSFLQLPLPSREKYTTTSSKVTLPLPRVGTDKLAGSISPSTPRPSLPQPQLQRRHLTGHHIIAALSPLFPLITCAAQSKNQAGGQKKILPKLKYSMTDLNLSAQPVVPGVTGLNWIPGELRAHSSSHQSPGLGS